MIDYVLNSSYFSECSINVAKLLSVIYMTQLLFMRQIIFEVIWGQHKKLSNQQELNGDLIHCGSMTVLTCTGLSCK